MSANVLTEDEIVAREQRGRGRAGLAAILAGVLGLGANIVLTVFVFDGYPRVPLLEALQDVAGQNPPGEGLRRAQLLFFHDKSPELLATTLVIAAAFLAMGYVLTFLYDAVRARNPALSPALRLAAPFGAIAYALSQVATQVLIASRVSEFSSAADQGSEAARDALRSGTFIAAQFVQLVGVLSLGVAVVMIALNAMRVGLLTRFMGLLGIIVGVVLSAAYILPLDQQGLVRSFWLILLGVLLLGRWPRGLPPAWITGRAEPWPTQQELREAREREQGASRTPPPAAPEAPRTESPSPATSARKKRKRRG